VEKIRVVVADDHPFVRIGIQKILSKTSDIIVVGEAGDGEQALHIVEQLHPDVLLLDVEMPRLNGIQVASHLQKRRSPVRILVLSAYEDRQHIMGMLDGGVSGYLTKEEVPDTLVKAVRGVAAGEKGWVSQRLADKLVLWRIETDGHIFISPRQREMLRLVAQKKTKLEIANQLGISEFLVEKNIRGLCDQIKANNLEELVKLAKKYQLIE
jgi:DNA-binding NarL/FixJ family response regulator